MIISVRAVLALIICMGVLCLPRAHADEAPKAGLEALIDALGPLTEDPAKAQEALKGLDEQRAAAESALNELNASLEAIRKQIAEAEAKKATLEKRLKAVEAGRKVLQAAFAVPTAPEAPAQVAAAPEGPAPAPATPAPAPEAPEATTASVTPANDPGLALFAESVRPIFEARCIDCHDAEKHRGGLDMSTRTALLKGGDSGPALIPGDADKSLLIKIDPPRGRALHAAQGRPDARRARSRSWWSG
jgi:uncharacterized coiled-coil protein SlyX